MKTILTIFFSLLFFINTVSVRGSDSLQAEQHKKIDSIQNIIERLSIEKEQLINQYNLSGGYERQKEEIEAFKRMMNSYQEGVKKLNRKCITYFILLVLAFIAWLVYFVKYRTLKKKFQKTAQ